jgi:hypothetical protein
VSGVAILWMGSPPGTVDDRERRANDYEEATMFQELTEELLDLQATRKGAGRALAGMLEIAFCTTTTCCCGTGNNKK